MICRTMLLSCLLASNLGGGGFSPFDDPSVNANPYRNIRVHVAFSDGATCDSSTRVVLLDRKSITVGQGTTDASCMVQFSQVPAGTYHVVVSGREFASTDSSDVVMNSPEAEEIEVRIRRVGEKASLEKGSGAKGSQLANAVVTVADYKVPPSALKEFHKANEAMARQEWNKAIERLQKAVSICPSYAAAYNNLGVAYARIGDRTKEREALENAIAIDGNLAPVYVNLARMHIATQNFTEAETALNKATNLDPRDGASLVMLANVEMMNRHFDEAIATSHKVHAMVQPPHSTVHWVAAHAFEQKKQYDAAISELVLFLSEEKSGARADQVRKELAEVESAPHDAIGN